MGREHQGAVPPIADVRGHLDLSRILRPQSAPDQIADRILAAIAVGILYPGDRLPPERELTSRLGVSRATLREAIGRLAAFGVLETRRGRGGGTFVTGVHRESEERAALERALAPIKSTLEALLDYRNVVEQALARAAAERRTDDDVAAMRSALAAYEDAASAQASRAADRALHEAIARATHNPLLERANAELFEGTNLGFDSHPYSPQLHAKARQQHRAIVDAIARRDVIAAGTLTHEHFLVTGTYPLIDPDEPDHTAARASTA
ncbi:GntR domain protein [Acidimicrobium ferrooxidans DSM 10331]|uniref:GntR domain protein n=1 Tax=Acidimicrobium ferrooxidans (strain DSM 10331 / JCM 15462 / NBRC 103882 / ICP) TaxID=525909 RepID=C7LZU4_ACIFD|nr:FCD domain-containing protein [Acidimicrobium ferrooxidans]ACU54252.1 GntR domain protein [Acidimicrobium ferrooxidans DSM 10331]